MEYHMLYVESRKSFKVRREKNYLFTELKKHLANLFLCRVLKKTLGKLISLSSATYGHSANVPTDGTRTNGCGLCRVPIFCRVQLFC